MGEVGTHGVEDGKAGGIEVTPVDDVGSLQPAQCLELVGGGAGAEDGDGGRGRRQAQAVLGRFVRSFTARIRGGV